MAGSKAVNRPVDLKQKEIDVNNKLQLFGIFQAFSNGKVPSNKQIDVALNSALAAKPLSTPSKKLSSEGQKLVGDLKTVIEQAKILLLTKNEGNLLQDFIWQAEQITGAGTQLPGAPIDKDTAKQHGNEALDGLRTLGTLLISNGQFRKLLSDASVLLRDIAGDAAQNTANKVKPSEDKLNQIDKPADDNTWHDTPELSAEKLKAQAKQSLPFGKGDAKQAAGDINQAAHPEGSRDPRDTAQLGAHEGQTGQSTGLNAQAALNVAKDKVDQNVSEEDKDKARARRDQLNNYLKGKMPEERRDQTIWRLKKMVVEIQGHQDYQRAIETLLRLAEQYTGHTKTVTQQATGTVKGAHQDDALKTAEADLKTLLERFANSTSFDDLIESINQIYKDADRDPELKNWFKRIDGYIRKVLQQQGYILEDESNEEWNRIYDQGHDLLRGRYRGHTDRIADEFKYIGEQFDADPQNKAFADSMNRLFNDLGTDDNGKTVFKPHLLKDITDVILPGFFESVQYIPIPRIEYSDPMIDAVVENLVIEGDNLAPNVLEFGSDNYWRWGRKSITNKNKNKVMLSVSGVQMDLRDVSYYIKRKQGFPSITDKGVMDIFMGGTGFSFKVEMETADRARENNVQTHFFKVNKIETDIQNLQIKLKKSNHKLLFNMFKPLLLKVMRPVIQKVLEKQIKDSVNQLDGMLYDIKVEADKAEAEAKRNPDPEHLQNMYQRYASAANSRIMQGKQKKEQLKEKTKDTQVNMAVTQHDSIFKNISLPGGISSKATEYKELAAKGDKWESPIFSIGSAKESTSLPTLPKVTRKPHGRAGGYGSDMGSATGAPQGLGASQGLNPAQGVNPSGFDSTSQYGTTQSGAGLTGGLPATSGTGAGLVGGLPGTQQTGAPGFAGQVDNAFSSTSTGAGLTGTGAPVTGATAAPGTEPNTFLSYRE
ncbi:hypothetical protein HBI56_091170 [Parastagonospora nodorum]|uniref:Uncharacterized protein n=1 Tax=Phaeosphaeria nodorum (strain SN15 / ATCC MYA-4574 / FGSC 10173) TaxID=321614 RepID=A0A7U2I7Y2_PHANO|nr:hypothetical protein HBH56_108270 [Parastagonospora nodorum]QRD03183.1 hypothetical protein JI435_099550 [Parastagonospora nodorum SN15]KAH3922253.1 hypothetical protein HBH54_225370 [Parastagonospora nodorum]KAH3951184.1 hypothetical protein HBH53_064050 [Parastagonospora nodorum]KAH3974261.1 hypothetical protein HBH51_094190 [Parastagonospora nodorum]